MRHTIARRVRGIILVCISLVCILQTANGSNEIKIREVPELGYDVNGNSRYICYKDLLIFDLDYCNNVVYKKRDGIYQVTDQTLHDMLKTDKDPREYMQYENLIVMLSEEETSFLLYDMDTGSTYSYPCKKGKLIDIWYIYKGKIYYMERMINDDGSYTRDKIIREIDLNSGKNKVIYQSEKPKLDYFWFFVREDGVFLCEWGEKGSNRREYWKIQFSETGKWTETKLWETNQWKYREWIAFNKLGLIVVGEFDELGGVYLYEEVVIKDNGETQKITIGLRDRKKLLLEKGYFASDFGDRATSVSFYDYDGNVIDTYQLIDEDYIKKDYYLVRLFYYDNRITGLYVQKSTNKLYIAQEKVKWRTRTYE